MIKFAFLSVFLSGTWFELKALPASESLLVEAGNPHEKSLATGQLAEFL